MRGLNFYSNIPAIKLICCVFTLMINLVLISAVDGTKWLG